MTPLSLMRVVPEGTSRESPGPRVRDTMVHVEKFASQEPPVLVHHDPSTGV